MNTHVFTSSTVTRPSSQVDADLAAERDRLVWLAAQRVIAEFHSAIRDGQRQADAIARLDSALRVMA